MGIDDDYEVGHGLSAAHHGLERATAEDGLDPERNPKWMLFCVHKKCNKDQGTALGTTWYRSGLPLLSGRFGCRVLGAVPVQGAGGLLELARAGEAHDGAVPEDGDVERVPHRSGAAVEGGGAARSIPPRLGLPQEPARLHRRVVGAPEAEGSVRRPLFFMCDRPVAPV